MNMTEILTTLDTLNLLVLLTLLRPSINVMFTAIILYDSCVGGISFFFPSKICCFAQSFEKRSLFSPNLTAFAKHIKFPDRVSLRLKTKSLGELQNTFPIDS